VTWRAKHFGIWQTLTSRITALETPQYFQDVMTQGAFRSMRHDHHFRSLPNSRTEMKDVFRFAAPIPVLGIVAEALVLKSYMHSLLQERNCVIKEIAESSAWQQYLPGSSLCEL
jgi:ligand-binding SRPBCC domain-containing protein